MNHRFDCIAAAERLAPTLAEHARRHDREGTFARESFAALREAKLMSALVPAELGGGGASLAELADAIRVLAGACGSTALTLSMHSHLVAATRWKHAHGGGTGEGLLRELAETEISLVSTGATDWVDSNGAMEKVDGGYRVTARKGFSSGCEVADRMITSSRYEDPERGARVLHFAVSFAADGVAVGGDWDTLGMRGTGSHSVTLNEVFVPDDAIALDRPAGEWHAAWTVAITCAAPLYMAAYLGIAEAARERALAAATSKRDAPELPYLVGELEGHLAAARLAHRALVDNHAGGAFAPDLDTANRALIHKTVCARAAVATVEKALEVAGGRGFFRASELERLIRDVHAAPYHPLPEKKQHRFTGRLALGLDPIGGRAATVAAG